MKTLTEKTKFKICPECKGVGQIEMIEVHTMPQENIELVEFCDCYRCLGRGQIPVYENN